MADPNKNPRPDLSHAVAIKHVDIDAIPTIRRLQHDAFVTSYGPGSTDREYSAFVDMLESSTFVEDLQGLISKQQIFGAFLDHRMVGIAAWSDHSANQKISQLRFLFVDPLFTRCGVESALLNWAKNCD